MSRKNSSRWNLGKPIERSPVAGVAEWEQHKKMLRLLRYYNISGERGARPWYELALAIAQEHDRGLRIVDKKPPGKTAPRWRGAEGLQLLQEVAAIRQSKKWRERRCLAQIMKWAPHRYADMSLDELTTRYHEAKRHHTTKRKRKARAAS